MEGLGAAVGSAPGGGAHVRVKVVPGSSRDALAGLLGDRLRVKVAAPPEGGRANRALLALLARALGVASGTLEVVEGPTSPRKTVAVEGLPPEVVVQRLEAWSA